MSSPIVRSICRAMEKVAPLKLAEKWDNVGLLLEAPFPRLNANRILLTVDLTAPVLEEALRTPTSFIVAYHPTLFKPLSSLTLSNPLQASLLRCAAAGISLYSPHTALDSIYGGINDWLARAFTQPISVPSLVSPLGPCAGDPDAEVGCQGRIVELREPLSLNQVVARAKTHLNLDRIQVAHVAGQDPSALNVRSIAICAGSGGSMLLGVAADVYFTGEMSHHEVLAAVAGGHNVMLCGHTNTERGYLPILKEKLAAKLVEEAAADAAHAVELRALKIVVSEEDKHPLHWV